MTYVNDKLTTRLTLNYEELEVIASSLNHCFKQNEDILVDRLILRLDSAAAKLDPEAYKKKIKL